MTFIYFQGVVVAAASLVLAVAQQLPDAAESCVQRAIGRMHKVGQLK